MSHDAHADHGSGHGHGENPSHGTLQSYLTGFALSVILTIIPFWLVMSGAISSKQATALIIMGLAFAQIIVHMIYFLHMNFKSEGGWSMLALVFTLVILVIALSGSLWVMYHLDANMAPTTAHDMSQMP